MSAQAGTISFACPQCNRPFAVPSSYAGRKATCKTCGGKVVVPPPVAPAPADDEPSVPQPGDTIRAVASGKLSPETVKQHILNDEATPSSPTPVEEVAPAPLDHAAAQEEAAPTVSEMPLERSAPTPQPHPVDPPAKTAAPRLPVRIRRLMADADQMAVAFTDFPPIRIKSIVGDPPEVYQIEYKVAGLQRGRRNNKPKAQSTHLVEIRLTSDYPRIAPQCRMLTPVFHPNIDETTICVGDHWTAGERLVDLVVRIGEMLAYQAYNIKSPLDGEAAMWADLNPDRLPTDSQNLRPSELT